MAAFEEAFESIGSRPVLFEFNTGDKANDELAREVFMASGVADWAEERQQKYRDYIDPKLMYVADAQGGESHHVAWVYHSGVRKVEGEVEPYATHHIVCDCVVDLEPENRLDAIFECNDVRAVLKQRAQDVAVMFKTNDVIGSLVKLDLSTLEFNSTEESKDVVEGTMGYLLETDYLHPEQWMANMRSQVLLVSTAALVVHERREEIIPILDKMQEKEFVEHDGITVKLAKAALTSTETD